MGGFLPSRRRFLGGAGVVVGLPFLESALPRKAWGQAAGQPILRFMPVFFPNGVDKRAYPKDQPTGHDWTQPQYTILQGLARDPVLRAKTLVLDGLTNIPPPYVHEAMTRCWLTGYNTGGGDENNGGGISADQVIADQVGAQTRIPSLQIGVYSGGSRYISWRGANQGLPPVGDPKQLFDKIFAGFEANLSDAEIMRRQRYETSVLDYVMGELKALETKVGRTDRRRLDQYTTEIRALEQTVINSVKPVACAVPGAPAAGASSLSYDKKLPILMDLAATALACDATRVITFFSNTDNASHPFIGVPQGHHDLSHWGTDVAKRDGVQKIDIWEIEQYAYLVGKLNAVSESGGRTLLDNSLVFFGSEVGEGDDHSKFNIPIIVNGTLGGALKTTGRYVRVRGPGGAYGNFGYGSGVPLCSFYLSAIRAFGVPMTKFGLDTIQLDLFASGQLG